MGGPCLVNRRTTEIACVDIVDVSVCGYTSCCVTERRRKEKEGEGGRGAVTVVK